MSGLHEARRAHGAGTRRRVRVLLLLAFTACSFALPRTAAALDPINPGRAQLPKIAQTPSFDVTRPFATCSDQTYALCATAPCFVFNGVAYCKCDVEHGDSISLPFSYGNNQNVCTANAEGVGNGYMISTYSLPASLRAPGGDMALYTCPAGTSNAAYAQCDGGYCFESTRGNSFPGFTQPLTDREIICSCPITVANPETAYVGFQIAGPWPCQEDFFDNCSSPPAGKNTGDTIYVGAPTGTGAFLTELLDGSVPPLHRCEPQR